MRIAAATLLILALARGAVAELGSVGDAVRVSLRDGSALVGCIVEQSAAHVTIRLAGGGEVRVARSAILEMGPSADAQVTEAVPAAGDPNDTRLMFGPTGRPLPGGEGYFSDHYVLFPGIAYGVTDHISIGGGVSVIPSLGLAEQVFYVSPRVGWRLSHGVSVSTGALYATGPDGVAAAVAFGVGTFGPPEASLTVGLGIAAERDEVYVATEHGFGTARRWEWRDGPILMLGGSAQVSRHVALVGESWLFLGEGFLLSEQPIGVAIRFFGERLSADVGVVLVPELLDEGFPIPWLSVSYRFGSPRTR